MSATAGTPAIEGRDLRKTYWMSEHNSVEALRGVDVEIGRGERVAIMGASGGGKSTLLNLLGTLAEPTAGRVLINDVDTQDLSENERSRLRNREIGFIFQQFNLIPRMTALENVAIALVPQDVPREEREARARRVLEQVGLGDRIDHQPRELSGGQQQRVAVARALVTEPTILLADEPTGQLDTATSRVLMELLVQLNRDTGVTLIIVTHDPTVEHYVERTIYLRDGLIVDASGYEEAIA